MPSIDIDPELTAILQALREREQILLQPRADTSAADLEALLDAQFWETGASGQHYSRDGVLRALEQRRRGDRDSTVQLSELRCRLLAEDVYLLTYRLRQSERITRRSSIWRRHGGAWQMLYHQGTVVTHPDART